MKTAAMNRAILLFGYPGSGKGTQGKILAALPGFRHIAMGDIFRRLDRTNPLYERVHGYLRQGDLVPDELVMELFSQYMRSLNLDPDDFVVIDGIPRNHRQVELLNELVRVIKIFKLSVYDEQLVINRMKKRAALEGRPDDSNDEVIQHRLQVYRRETEACITAYSGTMLTRIQANQPVFDVHSDIISAIGKMRNVQFR